MESTATATPDPQNHPTVRLDGKEYELKFRISDVVNLQKQHKIDLFVPAEVSGIAALEKLAVVIAAGITHTGAGITPEQIMDSIELGEVAVYALAVAEAQKKVSPESQAALKALQAMGPKKIETKTQVQ